MLRYVLSAALCLATGLHAATGGEPQARTYKVHHALTITKIPTGSQQVRVWFWFPGDAPNQKILDISVTAPETGYRITRDAENGHHYLYYELAKPTDNVSLSTDFVFRRSSVSVPVTPQAAGQLTEAHRREFAEYLRRDLPNMEVDASIESLADEICGEETNVVEQARKIFDHVVDSTDHYSKEGAPKNSGKGSTTYCLMSKGGGCTDQHALFIALARARGIPTRLHFGSRLQAKNEDLEVDPGYRCWVEYFVPNFGWTPMDISAADTNPEQRDLFFSGLDDRRVWFAEGRNLELSPKQTGDRLNLLIAAHVEIDGKPHAAFERVLKFNELHESALSP